MIENHACGSIYSVRSTLTGLELKNGNPGEIITEGDLHKYNLVKGTETLTIGQTSIKWAETVLSMVFRSYVEGDDEWFFERHFRIHYAAPECILTQAMVD